MVLILGLAGGAIACVKAYNDLRRRSPEAAAAVTQTIRQGAGVIFALAKCVFEVLSALQGIRPQTNGTTVTPTAPGQSRFGQTAGQLEAATA